MADRFGLSHSIGFNPTFKTAGGFVFGADVIFYFGNTVKETDILDGIRTSDGVIIGQDGIPAEVFTYQRGYNFNLNVGKVFSQFGHNPNSGLFAKIGVGYFQHKIRHEDRDNVIPQLKDEYAKGYDRLTSGIGITEFIGYLYLSNRRLLNFTAGLEFTQAFTNGRRSHQYDTNEPYTESRVDLLWGLRVGWIFPIYKRAPDDLYYY